MELFTICLLILTIVGMLMGLLSLNGKVRLIGWIMAAPGFVLTV